MRYGQRASPIWRQMRLSTLRPTFSCCAASCKTCRFKIRMFLCVSVVVWTMLTLT